MAPGVFVRGRTTRRSMSALRSSRQPSAKASFTASLIQCLGKCLQQHRGAIWRSFTAAATAPGHVRKLKPQHPHTLPGQLRRQYIHELTVHRRAGAMGQQQGGAGLAHRLIHQKIGHYHNTS